MERMLAVWHVPKDGSEATWIVYDKEQKSVTTPGEVQDVAPTALGDCLNFRIQSSVAVSLEYKNGQYTVHNGVCNKLQKYAKVIIPTYVARETMIVSLLLRF